jgi:hypothetical protein
MTATLRSMSPDASRTCWIRAMLLAKVATMTRPSSGSMISRKASPTVRSDGRVARVLGTGRVGQEAQDALLAEPARIAKSDSLPSTGVWSNLKSPVWTTSRPASAARCPSRPGSSGRPERDHAERPDLDLVAGLQRDERVVVELVLLDLVAEQAAGERARRRPGRPGTPAARTAARRRGPRGRG